MWVGALWPILSRQTNLSFPVGADRNWESAPGSPILATSWSKRKPRSNSGPPILALPESHGRRSTLLVRDTNSWLPEQSECSAPAAYHRQRPALMDAGGWWSRVGETMDVASPEEEDTPGTIQIKAIGTSRVGTALTSTVIGPRSDVPRRRDRRKAPIPHSLTAAMIRRVRRLRPAQPKNSNAVAANLRRQEERRRTLTQTRHRPFL